MIPPSTVAIRTPAVVVDKDAEEHCVKDDRRRVRRVPAHARRAGRVLQPRPTRARLTRRRPRTATDYLPAVKDLFTTDDLGGWDELVDDTVFGPDGAFTKAFQASRDRRAWRKQPSNEQRQIGHPVAAPGDSRARPSAAGPCERSPSSTSASSSCCRSSAILDRGFSDGLGNLADALGSFGAWNAIKLTLDHGHADGRDQRRPRDPARVRPGPVPIPGPWPAVDDRRPPVRRARRSSPA